MKMRVDGGWRTGLAGAVFALAVWTAPVDAQQSDAQCRCVDADGNEIEQCSCFQAPRLDGLVQWMSIGDDRPRLGISVDREQSARRDEAGALVTDVMEGGPADEAGIRRGDVITAIDGRSLFEPLASDAERGFDLDASIPVQRLLAIARELEEGEEVEVEFSRDGETMSATVTAEELSPWGRGSNQAWTLDNRAFRDDMRVMGDQFRAFGERQRELGARQRALRERDREENRFFAPRAPRGELRISASPDGPVVIDRLLGIVGGLELVALNPQLGEYFGAESGVLVAEVHGESSLGLEPGDVVLRVGDRDVRTPDHMRRILRSYDADEEVTLQIRRDGREMSVTGTVEG